MKNLNVLSIIFIFFSQFIHATVDEKVSRPPDCNITDEYYDCVADIDIEAIVIYENNINIQILEACTDTCDGNPFVSVTSDMDMYNFYYECSNTGYIDIEYTLVDACSNQESIIVTIHFYDYYGINFTDCNIGNTTYDLPCTDPDILSILDDWNQSNIAELQSCAFVECSGYNVSVFSNYDPSFICIDNSISVEYVVSDGCYAETISAHAFLQGYAESYVTGNNILDVNADGCDVNTDAVFPNLRFSVDGDSRIYHSNYSGAYTLGLQGGMHTIIPQVDNPDYFEVSPTSISVDFPTDTSPFNLDFCITPIGVYNDLEIYMYSGNTVPGFTATVGFIYRNVGNTSLSGNIDFNFDDDLMNFTSASPAETNSSIGNLTWNFTDLAPFEYRRITAQMDLNTPTDPTFPLNLDDILTFDVTINPVVGDETPENNVFTHNAIVVNSNDPNDVTCLEGEEIEIEDVGKYVHYRIRFDNNGTANATHVRVRDVIDISKFDVGTLTPLDGSHSFVTDIKNTNEVDFIFENINLPFDDANNDGYVLFKIKTLSSLVVGDAFSNQAAIYFDFNPAVGTNIETTTIIENGLGVPESYISNISVYPNPVVDELFFETNGEVLSEVTIYSISGQLVDKLEVNASSFKNKINLSGLAKGLYFIELQTVSSTSIKKIVKQ